MNPLLDPNYKLTAPAYVQDSNSIYTKQCRRCKKIKSGYEYYYSAKAKDGCRSQCKKCCNNSKDEWREENRELVKMYMRKIMYGITKEEYNTLFAAQNYCCDICKSNTPRWDKGWCTDHDPVTKKVRGILCHTCNLMVHKNITPSILRAAAEYLEKNQ